ncbi:SDR family NAD(P)-dependent oxidoreductase [Parasphingorhabdus sp. JC815]|uniref:SDR family NAD(P)-dependent oxidoreductase n=1 Tax=Parasphingorhabdus sp. JC815 TaxID=3232140 RepID=UPI00345ABA03
MSLKNKHIIVTGAASGIGRKTAIFLADKGAVLTLADIDQNGLSETAAMVSTRVKTISYDAADIESCKALISKAADNGIDCLCNIAGLLDWGPTLDFDEQRFQKVIAINLTSVFTLCRAALPYLIKSGGNIVNMASTAGLQGTPYTIAYAASKHAIIGLTKSLAVEFASQNVRVNAVAPGQVNTPMGHQSPPEGDVDWTLMMRNAPKLLDGICEPADIAELVVYLASDKARKMTGSVINIDGGQLTG